MEKILISACLVGDNTKYNKGNNLSPRLDELLEKYELVPFCPEVEGGLKTPRLPSERKGSKVIMKDGSDVTSNYLRGAELAYRICLYLGIKKAVLKENSPSCGVSTIYDGNFTNHKIKGQGVTTEYLRQKGITVYSEDQIDELLKTPEVLQPKVELEKVKESSSHKGSRKEVNQKFRDRTLRGTKKDEK